MSYKLKEYVSWEGYKFEFSDRGSEELLFQNENNDFIKALVQMFIDREISKDDMTRRILTFGTTCFEQGYTQAKRD